MKIKMRTLLCGPDGNLNAGEEATVSDARGRELVDGGYATELDVARVPETAMMPMKPEAAAPARQPETAVLRKGKK